MAVSLCCACVEIELLPKHGMPTGFTFWTPIGNMCIKLNDMIAHGNMKIREAISWIILLVLDQKS